jgi:hypothetical protein
VTAHLDAGERRVLPVPGGGSTVHGYFPDLAKDLATQATVIESDPPGIGTRSDRRPLRLSDYGLGWPKPSAEAATTPRESSGTAWEGW